MRRFVIDKDKTDFFQYNCISRFHVHQFDELFQIYALYFNPNSPAVPVVSIKLEPLLNFAGFLVSLSRTYISPDREEAILSKPYFSVMPLDYSLMPEGNSSYPKGMSAATRT